MKLLGLLPIASVAGLLAVGKSLLSSKMELQPEVIGYIGIFSGIFTLALFAYEVRSLLMCHDYSAAGADLETAMGVRGQFTRCNETRQFACYRGRIRQPLARIVNDKVTSTLIYSFVFAAWFFVGLRFAFDIDTHKCVWWALAIGVIVAGAAGLYLRSLTREPAEDSGGDETIVIVAS
jgi:hypothetical protein